MIKITSTKYTKNDITYLEAFAFLFSEILTTKMGVLPKF